MSNHYDFSDIAPFDDSQFNAKMNQLVDEPGFEHAVSYVMPDVNFSEFKETLRSIPDKETFQRKIMYPFLKMLEKKTTTAITCGGIENFESGKNAYPPALRAWESRVKTSGIVSAGKASFQLVYPICFWVIMPSHFPPAISLL